MRIQSITTDFEKGKPILSIKNGYDLKIYRENLMLKQIDFAKLIDISTNYLSCLEREGRPLGTKILNKVNKLIIK